MRNNEQTLYDKLNSTKDLMDSGYLESKENSAAEQQDVPVGMEMNRADQNACPADGPSVDNGSSNVVGLVHSMRSSDKPNAGPKEFARQTRRKLFTENAVRHTETLNDKVFKSETLPLNAKSRHSPAIPSKQLIHEGRNKRKFYLSKHSSCKAVHMPEGKFTDILNYSFDSIGLPTVRQETLPSSMIAPGQTAKGVHFQESQEEATSSAAEDSYLANELSASIGWLSSQLPLYSQDSTGNSQDPYFYPHPIVTEPFSEASEIVLTQPQAQTQTQTQPETILASVDGQQRTSEVDLCGHPRGDLASLPPKSNVGLDACRLLYSLAEQVGSSTQTKVHRLQQLHNKGKSMYLNRQKKFLWPAPREELEKSWLFDSQELIRNRGHNYLAEYDREIELEKEDTDDDESCDEMKVCFTPSPHAPSSRPSSRLTKPEYSSFECNQQTQILSNDSFLMQQVLYEIDRVNKQQLHLSKDTKLLIARGALDVLERVLVECSEMRYLIDAKHSSSVASKKQKGSKGVTNRKMDWRSIVHAMSYTNPENPNLMDRVEARMREYTEEDSPSH